MTRLLIWLAGWRRDHDGWWVRARRDTDPDLWALERSDIGFIEEGCIAVREPWMARDIDAGRMPQAHPLFQMRVPV